MLTLCVKAVEPEINREGALLESTRNRRVSRGDEWCEGTGRKEKHLSILCRLHSFLRGVPLRMECVQDTQIAEKIGREVLLRNTREWKK